MSERKSPPKLKLTAKDLEQYVGVQKYDYGRAEEEDAIGQVNGLAWTQVGGELLTDRSRCNARQGKNNHDRLPRRYYAGVNSGSD